MELASVPRLRRPLRSECALAPLRDRLARCVGATTLSLLDSGRIEALADDMRVIERKRVHHSEPVVCALVSSALERSMRQRP